MATIKFAGKERKQTARFMCRYTLWAYEWYQKHSLKVVSYTPVKMKSPNGWLANY